MTSICAGGGASQAKSGFGRTIYMAPSVLGAFLNNIPTVWAVPLAGYLGSLTYDLATFCTTDPPSLPAFTEDDVISLLTPSDVVNWLPARQKFQDLIGYFLWFQICECVSGVQPAPGAPPAAPANNPLVNPPAVGPSYPTGQPCAQEAFDDVYTPPTNVANGGTLVPLPTGATRAVLDATWNGGDLTSASAQTDLTVAFFNAGGGLLGSVGVGINQFAATPHSELAIPANTTQYSATRHIRNMATRAELWSSYSLICGTAGVGGPVPQPCPTDPFTTGLLQQILDLVTLVQRQSAPFAYVDGAVHAGLSGEGEIAVQGLLGIRVLLTSIPANVGVEDGDPLTYWQAGWFRWGNAEGFEDRRFITASPQVSFPAAAGQFTRIGYTLAPGVTAAITEVRREP